MRDAKKLIHEFLWRYEREVDHHLGTYLLHLNSTTSDDEPAEIERRRHAAQNARQYLKARREECGGSEGIWSVGLLVRQVLHTWPHVRKRMDLYRLRPVTDPCLDDWMVTIPFLLKILVRHVIENALYHCPEATPVTIGRVGDALVVRNVAHPGSKFAKRFSELRPATAKRLHKLSPEELTQPGECGLKLIVMATDILGIDRPRRRFVLGPDGLVVEMYVKLSS